MISKTMLLHFQISKFGLTVISFSNYWSVFKMASKPPVMVTYSSTLFFSMGLCALTALAQSVAPSTNEEQDLGNAAQLPLVVYSRHYNTPCYGDYVPTPTEADGKFSVSLAANEFEPIQIGLYVPASSDLLKKVTLDVDVDVPHKVGHIHYESYREHWRPIDKGRWYARSIPLLHQTLIKRPVECRHHQPQDSGSNLGQPYLSQRT